MGVNPNDFSKQYNYNYALVPWAEAFEAQADFTVGQDAAGISLIDRAWGTMVEKGLSTLFEESRYDGTPGYELGSQHNSVVHRWASGVGALLQRYVLGVAPTAPGFTTWLVDPHGASLNWAQGRVPTPEGPLTVWWRWKGSPANRHAYTLVLSAPGGTTGSVELPVVRRGLVVVDGHRVWSHNSGLAGVNWSAIDGRIVVPGLGPGTHVITWRS
jgi:alpha-L-rhamnosidase